MADYGQLQPSLTPMISVIVVNWNGGAAVLICLETLRSQSFSDFEVIIIDNGSTDGSPERIADRFPEYHLVRKSENLGFAVANNLAAQVAQGTWLALLNNDAFAETDWLEKLAEAAHQHPEFSGFASRQLQQRNPTLLDGAGDIYHDSGIVWRAGFNLPVGTPWDRPREIFIPCACAAMYRRDAFMSVGGFDESFFCYIEDVDLGFRMQLQSHRFMYCPDAVVKHVGSASTGKASDFARYHGHRNLVWCFIKNMPGTLLWKYMLGHILVNLASVVIFTLKGEGRPILRAKLDAIKGLPRVLAQRREVQCTRTASFQEIDRRMSHGLRSLIQRNSN